MLSVFFVGRVKNRKRYEEFACNVINDLFPREFPKREIDILVKFTKKDIGAMGWCVNMGDDTIGITVNTECEPEVLASTVAHELVHAKQYIRGELNDTMTRWKKKKVPYGPRGGCKIPYARQPWEREAFRKEKMYTELYW